MTFIQLADLIIHLDCIQEVKFSTYSTGTREIPLVTLTVALPNGALDGQGCRADDQHRETMQRLEQLELEGDLAIDVLNYFGLSKVGYPNRFTSIVLTAFRSCSQSQIVHCSPDRRSARDNSRNLQQAIADSEGDR